MKTTILERVNGHQLVPSPFTDWMDELLQDTGLFNGGIFGANSYPSFPPVNIKDSKEAYHLELAAPGLDKSDFRINLENNLLTISAEKQSSVEEGNKAIRKEFSYQSFKRSFTVDEQIDGSAISAAYENGVLKVTLPKKEKPAVNSKTITVQ